MDMEVSVALLLLPLLLVLLLMLVLADDWGAVPAPSPDDKDKEEEEEEEEEGGAGVYVHAEGNSFLNTRRSWTISSISATTASMKCMAPCCCCDAVREEEEEEGEGDGFEELPDAGAASATSACTNRRKQSCEAYTSDDVSGNDHINTRDSRMRRGRLSRERGEER